MIETAEQREKRYKKEHVKNLIRKDYGYPVLQRLLAEVIYETRKNNTRSLESRYNTLLKLLLGKPQKEIIKTGYKDDSKSLERIAVMTKSVYRKNPKSETRLKRFLTIKEACEEVARQEHIENYDFQTDIPLDYTMGVGAEVRATRERLLTKIDNQNSQSYAYAHSISGLKMSFESEEINAELTFIKTLAPNWIKRFYCQDRFEDKTS